MSSNSILKRLKTEANTDDDAGLSKMHMDDIAGSGSAVPKSESADVANNASIAAVFTEGILPSIFDNLEILTAKDLLHFRLVNRCWRDAATSVLLKLNLCEIQLDFGRVAFDEDGNAVAQDNLSEMSPEKAKCFSDILPTDKFFNAYQPSRFLADLNQLISTSHKFPSTSINFLSCYSERFGNVSPIPADSEELDENQKDLLNFLNLYGREIKALALCDTISKKAVQNLLYVHMPHLTCLNLRWFEFVCADEDEDDDEAWEAYKMFKVCLPPPSTLKVQEIILGYGSHVLKNEYNFVEHLFSVCPNLSSIQNVDIISTLGGLLKMGKCHLIKSLCFDPRASRMSTFKELFNYNLSRLKLSKLMVQLKESYGWRWSDNYDMVLKFLNLILSATKNSLTFLELSLSQSDHQRHIFIPQLPHLRSLQLDCSNSSGTTRFHFLGDVIGKAIEAGKLGTDYTITDFLALASQNQRNGKIPADYFPRLREVLLNVGEMESNPVNMMGFFPLEHLGPEDSDDENILYGDNYSKVTTLVLHNCPRYDGNLPRLFPNVSRLKICRVSIIELQNWVWTAFPKLERFEIYEKNGADRDTNVVDSFFTGISPELCKTLERDDHTTSAELKAQVFERTMPYIGDCKNLKEFKIHFCEKLSSNLASKVTAIHGYQQVIHRTEIKISFCSGNWSVDEIQETRRHLEPIAAYVKIEI